MLDRLLVSVPRAILVFLGLIAGVALIVLSDPPKTVCGSQLEVFRTLQTPFMYPDPKQPLIQIGLKKSVRSCKQGNGPGACLDFYEGLNKFLRDLDTFSSQCTEEISKVEDIKSVLSSGLDLTTKLAWGDRGPASQSDKLNWMDTSHVDWFCRAKKKWIELYGEEDWAEYREKLMSELPNHQALGRNETWKRSLVSLNCQSRI
jgi:hypothetical protein